MQKKYQNKQAPDRVLGIRRLLWCSPVSSTAAPQTCRRSPSPSRTQRSLPSKVKQINPRLLTYPPPRFPPTITTARSPFINSDKTQKHKKKTTAERLPPRFYLRIAFYVSLYFEGCSLFPPPAATTETCPWPHVTPVTRARISDLSKCAAFAFAHVARGGALTCVTYCHLPVTFWKHRCFSE